jgi:flavin-dependent dehydrogenase
VTKRYDYDAIIVGARCAGASTAMLLARKGHRVLLVDRAHFPSEIPHGHFIHRDGPPRLARWGLLNRIVASGCPPVTNLTFDLGDFPLSAQNVELDGIAWGFGPRRGPLDQILVDAATTAGAELRQGLAVDAVLIDDERVVGVSAVGSTRITARLTVGADGKHSRVARAVKAPVYESVPTLMCWYFTYFRALPTTGIEVYVVPRREAVFVHPTNDGVTAILVAWPIDEFASVRMDLEARFMAALDLVPALGQRVRSSQRVERIYGTGDMPNFLRKPFGQGWALVGDAGCHKDPLGALGMSDALRDAELLAEAAHEGLSGNEPLESALARYELQRNEATLPAYQENLHAAQLEPVSPDVLRLRQALRDSPSDAIQFFLARDGRIPHEAFFNPPNLERILGSPPPSPGDRSISGVSTRVLLPPTR